MRFLLILACMVATTWALAESFNRELLTINTLAASSIIAGFIYGYIDGRLEGREYNQRS